MAFYLRKALSSGPIRLNFSKGGIGISGGVTGARIGLNSRGAYIHGGRHGIYYRKQLGRGKRSAEESPSPGRAKLQREEYYVDTGASFGESLERQAPPQLPEAPRPNSVARGALGLAALLALPALLWQGFWLLLALLSLALGLGLRYRHQRQKEKGALALARLERALDQGEALSPSLAALATQVLPGDWGRYYRLQAAELLLETRLALPEKLPAKALQEHLATLALAPSDWKKLAIAAFQEVFDQALSDHVLSAEEEEALRQLEDELELQAEDLPLELRSIKELGDFRRGQEEPLVAIASDLALPKGELVYWQGAGRLLKSKIQDRYQRNKVQYRALGYEIEEEGQLVLTDRALRLVHEGSRRIPLTRILDLTLSIEDHSLQLKLDGRKSPLVISSPDLGYLAGRLEQVLALGG